MKQIYPQPRPLFCDNNAFRKLANKANYNRFIEELGRSNSVVARELVAALQNNDQVQEPLMFLENFGIPQKVTNKKLEIDLLVSYTEHKTALAPFIKEFEKSIKDESSYLALAEGFSAIVDKIYENCFEILEKYDELSLDKLVHYLETQREITKDS